MSFSSISFFEPTFHTQQQVWFQSGCFSTPQLEGTLNLEGLLLLTGFDGQHHLHFLAGGGVGDLVDLGKTLTDVHECFIFGLGQDNIEIDGGGDAYGHKHQEGKRLQRLLQGQKGLVRRDGNQTQHARPGETGTHLIGTTHRWGCRDIPSGVLF